MKSFPANSSTLDPSSLVSSIVAIGPPPHASQSLRLVQWSRTGQTTLHTRHVEGGPTSAPEHRGRPVRASRLRQCRTHDSRGRRALLLLVVVGAFVALGGLAIWLVGRLRDPAPPEPRQYWARPPSSPGCAPTRSEMLSSGSGRPGRSRRGRPPAGRRSKPATRSWPPSSRQGRRRGADETAHPRPRSPAATAVRWPARRALFWESHERRCARCGSTVDVVLHHLTYDWAVGEEPDAALMPLGRRHHLELTGSTRNAPTGPSRRSLPRSSDGGVCLLISEAETGLYVAPESTQAGRVVPRGRSAGERLCAWIQQFAETAVLRSASICGACG
jgi:hypothetical protein